MAKSLNQCNFIGNLGNDPDVRYLPDGKAVANFSIAISDDYKKDGQTVEQTEWVRIVLFGRLAEIAEQYLKKGSKIFASGKIKTRSYEQDGVKKYTTEIVANEMQMLDSRVSQATGNTASAPTNAGVSKPAQQQPQGFDDLEDLPF